MADIATLGLRLEGQEFKATGTQASEVMDRMAASADRVEQSTKKVQAAVTTATAAERQRIQVLDQTAQRQRLIAQAEAEWAAKQRANAAERARSAATSARDSAQAAAAAMEERFQADMARIKDAQARSLISPKEAARAGAMAATEFNAAMVANLDRLSAQGITGRTDPKLYTQLAGSLKNVGASAQGAGIGVGRLGQSFASLASSATGAHPALAQLSYAVGSFGLGSAWMIAVLGGVAALGLAWKRMSADAREAKKATDEAIQSLKEAGRVRGLGVGGEAGAQTDLARAERDRLESELSAAREALDRRRRRGAGQATIQAAQERVAQIQAEYNAARRAVEEGERQVAEAERTAQREGWDRVLALRKEIAQERIEALKYELASTADLTADLTARIMAAGAMVTAPFVDFPNAMDDARESAERLWAALGQMSQRGAASDLASQVEALVMEWAALPRSVEQNVTTHTAINRILAETGKTLQDLPPFLRDYIAMMTAAEQETSDMLFIVEGLGDAFGVLGDIMSREASRMVRALQDVVRAMKDAEEASRRQQLAGAGLTGLGVGYQAGSTFGGVGGVIGGAVGGAATGFAIAGPVGAVVGGIGGLIGGLIGAGKKAREAAEEARRAEREWARLQEQRQQWAEDIARSRADFESDLFIRESQAFGGSRAGQLEAGMEKELRAAQALLDQHLISETQYERLARVLQHELNVALREAADAAQMATRALTDDLTARGLAATGQGGAASLARLRAGHAQELRDAQGQPAQVMDLLHFVQEQEVADLLLQQAVADQTRAIEEAAAAQVSALDEQIRLAEEDLRTQQDQLRTQERQVAALRQVVDSLSRFADELKLGGQSPLSPIQQLGEARRQFEALAALAAGGDITAGQSLPGASQALLSASRGVYASGAGYAADFARVLEVVEAARGKFAGGVTVEERILSELQAQSTALSHQINELQARRAQALKEAQDQINAIQAAAAQARADAADQLTKLLEQIRILELIRDLPRSGGDGGGIVDIDWKPVVDELQASTEQIRRQTSTLGEGFSLLVRRIGDLESAVDRGTDTTRLGFESVKLRDS